MAAVLLLLAAEVIARVVVFQLGHSQLTALQALFDRGRVLARRSHIAKATHRAAVFAPVYRASDEALFEPVGAALRGELEAAYERSFAALVRDVAAVGSKLVVVNFLSKPRSAHGAFVAKLADRHGVGYLDFGQAFLALPKLRTRLLPLDWHLTRYGNEVVARRVAGFLDRYRGHRSGRDFAGRPPIVGDYGRSVGKPWLRHRSFLVMWKPGLGFAVGLNRQGLRMNADLEVPKRRQRVLCLGDSYTFGPHVNNQDTYPAILGRLRPDLEVVNAGICGYTVSDELSLFQSSARHIGPDITVLQVCDNDLLELTSWARNRFARKGRGSYRPSAAETAFFDGVHRRLEQQKAAAVKARRRPASTASDSRGRD